MPIQFRCHQCNQKLSISRRKAGAVVTCPACRNDLQVPTLEQAFLAGLLIESPGEEPVGAGTPKSPEPEKGELGLPRTDDVSAAAGILPGGDLDDEDADEQDGFRLERREFPEDGLDMTPMVDVTFLLLIFFMITASFSLQKSMEADAPQPEQEGAAQLPTLEEFADDSVIVEIDENNAIFVDDQPVSGWQDLEDVLTQKINSEQKREMVIEPHYRASHGTVVQVTDAGVQVGMQRIRRVTQGSD